ncbi:MAG TPA: phytanoyl-CoA dioxygenase family protein [Limnochordia bacterium]|nr:phytanoyl-CoA dioxygenase family protein [Limnochordia bacterium]
MALAEQPVAQPVKLSAAQRLHFDIYGYVMLRGVLTPDEVRATRDALYKLHEELKDAEPGSSARVRGARITSRRGTHYTHFGHLVEADPALLHYAAHPGLVPLVEQVVGGSVRLEETEAIINHRDPDAKADAPQRFGFHVGTRHGYGTYVENELFHCTFVKTLAFLTDIGPEDGGTVVIAGSHKLGLPQEQVIAAAYEDPSLIHQTTGKAGDVLLFAESLIHATGRITSDRERVIIVSGYTPPFMREWPGYAVSDEFLATLDEEKRRLLSGSESWHWRRSVSAGL